MTAELGVEAPLRTERERAESVPERRRRREGERKGCRKSNDNSDGDDDDDDNNRTLNAAHVLH